MEGHGSMGLPASQSVLASRGVTNGWTGNGRACQRVVEAKPGQSFAWAVGDPAIAAATWRFDLYLEGNGTRIRQQVELGPGPSGLTRRIDEVPDREEEIIGARLSEHHRNMQSTLVGIKSSAEQNS